jgi:molybdate transport system substrate-binding protein
VLSSGSSARFGPRSVASLFLLLATGSMSAPGGAAGETLRLAVASNFREPLEAIGERFEASSGHRLVISPGSTGKQFAQISHGAPFDLFLAADAARPRLLEERGLAVAGSRFTYALGRLVLWSSRAGLVDPDGRVLEGQAFSRLSLANPRHAPYGAAAREVLERRGVWEAVERRLVRGENVAQAFQFVASGSVELGFIALSQLYGDGREDAGSSWRVPAELHAPIEQQVVLLRDGVAARSFLEHLRSPQSRELIREFGYSLPGDPPTP